MKFIFLTLLIVSLFQPSGNGNGGGNGGPGNGMGNNPCQGPHPPPSCGNSVPIEGDWILLLIGGSLYFIHLKYKKNEKF